MGFGGQRDNGFLTLFVLVSIYWSIFQMTDCVAVCLTLLGQFSKPDSCQATHLKSYLNISAFTRLAGPRLDTKGCKKHLATYNLSTDCAKFPFKNCCSCLKAAILIFKYPPQNVKCELFLGGRESILG